MIGKTISHYKILEKLGEGGMGTVYKAKDTKLKRLVALKFLPPDLTRNKDTKKRFIHEAQAASALEHTNICAIHEIDETDEGQLFISMGFYEGDTVEEKVKQKPLGINEAIDITIQVAHGLDKAHKKKIVHRDIKSANIIVTTEGITKIVDFGIAKLAGQTQVTKDGTSLGTASYMSPEQTLGKEVDHRTDIWSLGVVLYEMLTGLQPFPGDYEQAVVYSIMNEEPKSLTGLRVGIPLELDRIVNKTLAKKPNERYQHLDELIVDLKHVKKEPEKEKTNAQVPQTPIIAVLPFTNMSADKDQDYFCDGIAEDILNDLTHLEGLHVVARSSSFALRDKHQDVRGIGLKLGADTLVEGSVRKAGNRLRITAQLINVSDGMHLWSERYDRDLEDVFAIQDEIAKNIVEALEVKLSTREKSVLGKVKTQDIQAYDYYLKGREFFHKGIRKNIEYASEMFVKAIEEDSNYALAHAGLANCYSYLFMYYESNQDNLERSASASKKALELDRNLAEAHSARGLAVSLNRQYSEAEKEFDKAIELNPKLYEAYYFYARTYRQQGNFKNAVRLFEKASEVRPEDYQAPLLAALTYRKLKLSDKANETSQRAFVLAEKHLQLNPNDARALYLGGAALADLGEIDKAIEWCERAIAIDPNDPSVLYNASCIYSLSGKIDQALEYFEGAIDSGFASKEWIETDRDLDPIRNQPRFKEILAKLN
jgi:serine/threonine protein kinase/thioredoxin-like negative regulator of GroEL